MSLNDRQRTRFRDALTRVAGDESMLIMLSEIVVSDAPALMSQLGTAVADADTKAVARTAHALKGLLSSFETGDPTERLQSIIDAAREHDMDEVNACFAMTEPGIEKLLFEIKQICATSSEKAR